MNKTSAISAIQRQSGVTAVVITDCSYTESGHGGCYERWTYRFVAAKGEQEVRGTATCERTFDFGSSAQDEGTWHVQAS